MDVGKCWQGSARRASKGCRKCWICWQGTVKRASRGCHGCWKCWQGSASRASRKCRKCWICWHGKVRRASRGCHGSLKCWQERQTVRRAVLLPTAGSHPAAPLRQAGPSSSSPCSASRVLHVHPLMVLQCSRRFHISWTTAAPHVRSVGLHGCFQPPQRYKKTCSQKTSKNNFT